MKRLTETRTVRKTIIREGEGVHQFQLIGSENWHTFDDETVRDNPVLSAVQKLAEYEDAEENGNLFRLPYIIGETVYVTLDRHVIRFEVNGYQKIDGGHNSEYVMRLIDFFGNCVEVLSRNRKFHTVFATYEEAEAALKAWEASKGRNAAGTGGVFPF